MKVVARKQKEVESEVNNQQIKYFIALRDRKLAFINKMYFYPVQIPSHGAARKRASD